MTTPPPAPTEPSAEAPGDNGLTQAARALLTELQWIILGDEATPDPEAMAAIYTALTAARREGAELDEAARECLTDVLSHYNEFSAACSGMRDRAECDADRSYWQHQVDVLARMERQADSALAARDAAMTKKA